MSSNITSKEIKQLLNHLKASAKKRGIFFDLTTADIDDIGIPISCPVLGIPLKFNKGVAEHNSISFDRIDSSKGYTKENIIIVSNRVNQLKSDASLEEMRKIADYYADIKNSDED